MACSYSEANVRIAIDDVEALMSDWRLRYDWDDNLEDIDVNWLQGPEVGKCGTSLCHFCVKKVAVVSARD